MSAAPQRPATVLVNLMWLVPGVVGGSEESVTDALRAVAAAAPDDLRVRLAVLPAFVGAHPDLVEAFPDPCRGHRRRQQGAARARGADAGWRARHAGWARMWCTTPAAPSRSCTPDRWCSPSRTSSRSRCPGTSRWSSVRTCTRCSAAPPGRPTSCASRASSPRPAWSSCSGCPHPRCRSCRGRHDRLRRPRPRATRRAGARRSVPAVPGDHLSPQEPPGPARRVRTAWRGPPRGSTLVLTGGSASSEPAVLARIDELGLDGAGPAHRSGRPGPPRGPVRSRDGGGRALALRRIRPAGARSDVAGRAGGGGACRVVAGGGAGPRTWSIPTM